MFPFPVQVQVNSINVMVNVVPDDVSIDNDIVLLPVNRTVVQEVCSYGWFLTDPS